MAASIILCLKSGSRSPTSDSLSSLSKSPWSVPSAGVHTENSTPKSYQSVAIAGNSPPFIGETLEDNSVAYVVSAKILSKLLQYRDVWNEC